MKCPQCQYHNPDGLDFCGKCGTKLEGICPACHFVNPEGFQFCGRCGRQLDVLAARQIESAIEEERKQVTVLFSDLSGYTAMSERLDPEEVKKIMNRIFGEMSDTVSKYEGTIQKFIGDAVVAFFGVPKVHEDDPVRAIRAAREIHERIEDISPQFEYTVGKRLAMHSGINTGLVVTGEVTLGKGILGITGDTVNLASRLSTLARPGEILVGHNTFRRADWLFDFEPLVPARVKGKTEPVKIYRVVGKKEKTRRSVGFDSPLVGREKEMDLLSLQVVRLINGQGGIITVIGEPGIGKSRLLAELRQTAAVKKTVFLEGRAISMGRSLSFYPIVDALKYWSQIRGKDTDAEAQWKLERAIRDIHPEEAGEIFPFIATLMGMKLNEKSAQRVLGIEGEALEKLIFRSMRELLIRGSEVRPMMIYMEDFHWVDTSSLELLKALFRLVEECRILFIIVFRPGYTDTGERIIAFIQENYATNWTKIELEPLKESESGQLLNNLLEIKSFPHLLREQILQRAGGNPFFIEEVVRSLIIERAVVQEKGEYRVTEKIEDIVIPQSIHALIMARIDRLDEGTKNLVRIASVIGRNFFYRILTAVAGHIEKVDSRLEALKEIQLIRERKRMEEVEYLFAHALTQEAVYESILIQRRKEIHQKVAQSIEKIFSERIHEFYGMLAYHYCRAESLEKAEEYLIKAGEEALRSAASDEALHYYEEALQLYLKKSGKNADPEKVAMLEKNIALALYNRGQHQEAIRHFDKTLDYYWGKLPKATVFELIKLSWAFSHFLVSLHLPFLKFKKTPTERDVEIVDLFSKKINSISLTNAKRFFIEYFYLFRFISSFDLRKFREGYGIFVMASALFAYSGISFALSKKALNALSDTVSRSDVTNYTMYEVCETVHHFLGGNWKALKDYDDDLVDKNCRIGEIYNASQYLFWHGLGTICQGSFDKARAIMDRLQNLYEVYGNSLSEVFKYEISTMLLIESGKLNDALIESEKGIAFGQKAHSNFWWGFHTFQAWIHIMMNAIDKAEECLEQADRIRVQTETAPFQISYCFKTHLEYNLYCLRESTKSGNREEMDKFQREAIKSIRSLGRVARKVAYHRTDSYRLTGAYYWTINDHKKALGWWHRAVQEGERLGARPQLARLYFEVGRCLLEEKAQYKKLDNIKGEAYLGKARAWYEEMKMETYLEEIDRLVEMRGF